MSLVELAQKETYAVITLNRPEKRNALNQAAQAELRAALDDVRDTARVVVITGTGAAFCSGIDVVELAELRAAGQDRETWFETQEHIRQHPAVFIAAVNGFALGGGLTLVHNSELAVAAETAEFGMPEVSRGMFPTVAGPATVKRILPKHAAQMIFMAQRISAAQALAWGIVNEVLPADQVLPRAEEMAAHIAQFDPTVLAWGKKAFRELGELDWTHALEYGIQTGVMIRARKRP